MAKDFLSPESLRSLQDEFTTALEQGKAADAARAERDRAAKQGAQELLMLEQERAAALKQSATVQEQELGQMAAGLDRMKQIDDSLLLQIVEPVATMFNVESHSRELLARDMQRNESSLALESARAKITEDSINQRAREVDRTVQLKTLDAESAAGNRDAAARAASIRAQAMSSLSQADQLLLEETDDSKIDQLVKDGTISAERAKREKEFRQSKTYQLRAQARSDRIGQLQLAEAELSNMTEEQLMKPETAQRYGARAVQDQLRSINVVKMKYDNLSASHRQNRLAMLAFEKPEAVAKMQLTDGERRQVEIKRAELEAGGVESANKLRKNLEEQNNAFVKSFVTAMPVAEIEELEARLAAEGGVVQMETKDGFKVKITAEDVAPIAKLRKNVIVEQAIVETATESTVNSANAALESSARSVGAQGIINKDASPVENIDAVLTAGAGQLSSEAVEAYETARSHYKAALSESSSASPQTRIAMLDKAEAMMKTAEKLAVDARVAAQPKAVQPAATEFVRTGKINTAANATAALASGVLASEFIANPAYASAMGILQNSVNRKLGRGGESTKLDTASVVATMQLGKQQPIDLATAAAADPLVHAQMAQAVQGSLSVQANIEVAKALGADEIAARIESGVYVGEDNRLDTARIVEDFIAMQPNKKPVQVINDYRMAIEKAAETVRQMTQPSGQGDLQIAAINKMVFANAPEAYVRDATIGLAIDGIRAYFNSRKDAAATATLPATPFGFGGL